MPLLPLVTSRVRDCMLGVPPSHSAGTVETRELELRSMRARAVSACHSAGSVPVRELRLNSAKVMAVSALQDAGRVPVNLRAAEVTEQHSQNSEARGH